ncbi:YncE family protein [Lysinibacillus capsici]|uniref:YncE family protein n=1 Tax=Lysinibacillus TaxID=400634 RepID=UPI0021A63EC7|nr:YncE family protein [Lysinibacillus capsici]MCT1571228.1 YncE family protein [Lysinibacillus capsici]MCT1647982.1 YncE family protein [Lysinibacillus capsici]MCT1783628.1 YncE family protein [Lysinibacillus capsici]MDP1414973.1 YncE family protein [Lysinibacillus capsici]
MIKLKKWAFFIFSLLQIIWLAGCAEKSYEPIERERSFIASLNIQEPSLDFIDEDGNMLATWLFDKAYSGAILLGDDQVLLYGHQLNNIDVYTISTGEKLYSKKVEIGTTNVYYDDNIKQFFITNSKTNTVTSFDQEGNQLASQQLGNYPMSMTSYRDKLYVINFKDTKLSVLNMKDLKIEQEWPIQKSAHGIVVLEEKHELWVGGHGEGSKPNSSVKKYDLTTGQLHGEIDMPLMPVGIKKTKDAILVVSHGHNELYVADFDGHIKWQQEVGANPFVVDQFKDYIVVAGYDDHTLYFIKDGQKEKTVDVGKGAFQLLVREEQ